MAIRLQVRELFLILEGAVQPVPEDFCFPPPRIREYVENAGDDSAVAVARPRPLGRGRCFGEAALFLDAERTISNNAEVRSLSRDRAEMAAMGSVAEAAKAAKAAAEAAAATRGGVERAQLGMAALGETTCLVRSHPALAHTHMYMHMSRLECLHG